MALQELTADVLAEATGRRRRSDAVVPGGGGPAGNARLTAATGLVLLALFLAELVTLLDVSGLIGWHVAIGVLLVPPALLRPRAPAGESSATTAAADRRVRGALVVAVPVWLFDVCRRRSTHQGPLMRRLSRVAFAAFLVHQVLAVWAVLATRYVAWPPEVEYLTASVLAVAASFGVGSLLIRLPDVSWIL